MAPDPKLPEPARILVVMLRRIGDVLLTTPAVRALRGAFPAARVDFLAEPPCGELFEPGAAAPGDGRPARLADGFVACRGTLGAVLDARGRGYDWVVDFMGNPRSAIITAASGARVRAGPGHVAHRWAYSVLLRESSAVHYSGREKLRVLRCLGLDPDEADCLPALRPPPEAEAWAAAAPVPAGEGPIVGLVPASRRETRRWPAASFAALGRLLRGGRGARLVVFWGPGEEGLAAEVASLAGPGAAAAPRCPTLMHLAALLGRCGLVVTNCNGPKHLAVARGTPTLTVHGSSDPRVWNPEGDPRHQVARLEDLPCIACRLNACPRGLECMRGLSPEAVAGRAIAMLDSPAAGRPA